MSRQYVLILVILTLVFTWSCESRESQNTYDTLTEGKINISVDETFKPVIEEQIKVFESSYPKAKINAAYKSEADCLRDLQEDSTRMIIVARGLTPIETEFFANKLGYEPSFGALAYDAVAVIVNKDSKDSLITIEQLSSYLNGSDSSRVIVLDGTNATSTVRYVMDSLLQGQPFGNNVVAATNSEEVIEYVGKNRTAIGMIGFSWIGDETNPQHQQYLKKVQLALVECKYCEDGTFARPTQVTIARGQYSLWRGLFYIIKENSSGLGSGFKNFLSLERGQLIFRRSNLVPAKMGFGKRRSSISEEEQLK